MNRERDELMRFIRRSLMATDGRVLVSALQTTEGDNERVTFAITGAFDQVGDCVTIADQLLRHVSETIIRGLHPDCEACRDRLKRIEAARAALDVTRQEKSS